MIDMDATKKSDEQVFQTKNSKMMETIAFRAGYYRANPQRFVEEFLGIKLKLFQKILIWAMMECDAFYFVAARGIGR